VVWHKGGVQPGVRGYKRERQTPDAEFPLLQRDHPSEIIQDKSLDDRLIICHTPAYE